MRGQFIDTYLGEIITNAEADLREQAASSNYSNTISNTITNTSTSTTLKASYLFTLDKHAVPASSTNGDADSAYSTNPTLDDCFVVDGEHMGSVTRFMNHSCDPNCRQYVVSYNKYDTRKYELAFFACRDVEADEELTFDYLDKDEDDEDEDEGEAGEGDREGGDERKKAEDAMECLCGTPNCRGTLWM